VSCRSDLLKPDATGSTFFFQQDNGLGTFQAPISRKNENKGAGSDQPLTAKYPSLPGALGARASPRVFSRAAPHKIE